MRRPPNYKALAVQRPTYLVQYNTIQRAQRYCKNTLGFKALHDSEQDPPAGWTWLIPEDIDDDHFTQLVLSFARFKKYGDAVTHIERNEA